MTRSGINLGGVKTDDAYLLAAAAEFMKRSDRSFNAIHLSIFLHTDRDDAMRLIKRLEEANIIKAVADSDDPNLVEYQLAI
jgi:uncharacterized protein (UPF0276 family)